MKKILAVNIGSKKFGQEFLDAADLCGVSISKIRMKGICFHLKGGDVRSYHNGELFDVSDYNYAFIRVRGKYAHMLSIFSILLQKKKIPFNDENNTSHSEVDEKVMQMMKLSLAKMPIPETVLFSRNGFEKNKQVILSAINFPCVCKVNGSKGKGVWKIDSIEMLEQKLPEIDTKHEVILLQEYIPNTYDIRILYFHGKCLGAIKRMSSDGFYNNVAKGGQAEKIVITKEEEKLGKKASFMVGTDFSGVDIVRTDKGPMIFEVNKGPQVYGFEDATGMNVPLELVKLIKKKLL